MLDHQEALLVIRGLWMLSLTTRGTRVLMNLYNNNITLLQVLEHVWTTAYSVLTGYLSEINKRHSSGKNKK